MTVGRAGTGIRLVERRSMVLRSFSLSSMAASAFRSVCRWSASFRSRMRWSLPVSLLRRAATPAAVFAALGNLRGAKGRLELVGEKRGAPIFVDYAHKPDALAKAIAALRPYVTGKLDRRVRRRRRPRSRQAAADGRRRRRKSRQGRSSRMTIRAARIPPPSAPLSWPRRPALARSGIAARRSARQLPGFPAATFCSLPAKVMKPAKSSATEP